MSCDTDLLNQPLHGREYMSYKNKTWCYIHLRWRLFSSKQGSVQFNNDLLIYLVLQIVKLACQQRNGYHLVDNFQQTKDESRFIFNFCTGTEVYVKTLGHRPCRLAPEFFCGCCLIFSFTSLSSLPTLSLSLPTSSSSFFSSALFSKTIFQTSQQSRPSVRLKLWCGPLQLPQY